MLYLWAFSGPVDRPCSDVREGKKEKGAKRGGTGEGERGRMQEVEQADELYKHVETTTLPITPLVWSLGTSQGRFRP